MEKRKAVFLDRDGTLIEEVDFLSRIEDLCLFSFTYDAVRQLKDAGFLLIVITNQSGIGRGIYDEKAMHAIHSRIQAELDNTIDAFYFCPHLPEAGCVCRKPGTGMIDMARVDFAIDLSGSWIIGDKSLDIETGQAVGISTALVLTGYGHQTVAQVRQSANLVAENLLQAVRQIVAKP